MKSIYSIKEEWREQLDTNSNGYIKKTANNAKVIIENDQNLQNIVYNVLSEEYEVVGPLPWAHEGNKWRDQDESLLTCYMHKNYSNFTDSNIRNGFVAAVDSRSYNPIKQYFESLPDWDAVNRVDRVFIDYLGAPDTEYVRMATRIILVAAYKRAKEPGLKFDNIVVLNGPQGIGKSTLLSKLGMNWYTDSLSMSDMNDKTAAEKLQGNWIVEIGEMAGMRKADMEKAKAFLSRQDDKYRAAYGRRVTNHPRKCVFFGTTNTTTGYLRDITGNRRYWNIEVSGNSRLSPFDLDQHTVDLIWSEVRLFGHALEFKLYLEGDALKQSIEEQNKALEYDEREGLIREYLDKPIPNNWNSLDLMERKSYTGHLNSNFNNEELKPRKYICNMEIWSECLGQTDAKITKRESQEIATIMKRIGGWSGCEKQKRCGMYGNQRVYERLQQNN